jgi:hypothetical protein
MSEAFGKSDCDVAVLLAWIRAPNLGIEHHQLESA